MNNEVSASRIASPSEITTIATIIAVVKNSIINSSARIILSMI